MMEALNLVEVVLNQGNEEEHDKAATHKSDINKTTPIKALDESVTITVTRTPGRPPNSQRQSGKPANFALLSSPVKSGRNSDAIRVTPREEMICNGCRRIFKYKAAFIRHEAQCGLPLALRIERAAVMEAKKVEKAAEIEKRRMEEKLEKPEKPPQLRCPTCLKQFYDHDSFNRHNFQACAAERATYTFVCDVCKARFKYKNHLRRHEDSHNNVRRYNCDVCTTAFLRPDHLKRHMMRMHGIFQLPAYSALDMDAVKSGHRSGATLSPDDKNAVATIKNAPMQCPMCSKILSRRDHVLRHMRNVHHTNYEPRKRGATPDLMLEFEGLSHSDRKIKYQDDEDGSENQSMTSQDDLLIDESFESVKRETTSPGPNDTLKLERRDSFSDANGGSVLNESYQHKEPSVKREDFLHRSFGNNLFSKTENNAMQMARANCNGATNHEVDTITGCSLKMDRFDSHPVLNHGPANFKSNCDFGRRLDSVSNSEGNQNVLSNGHGVRNETANWISDLANYGGW